MSSSIRRQPADDVPFRRPVTSGGGNGTDDQSALAAEVWQWRACAVLLLALVLVAVGQAVLWAWIAPGQRVVYQNSAALSVPTESLHQFTSIAIFALLGLVVGVTSATAAWRWRAVRGTATLISVILSNAVGALVAYLLGRNIAAGVDIATVGPASVNHLVLVKPVLGSAMVIVAQPAFAAIVYTFLVAWNGQPALGRTDQPVAAPVAAPAQHPNSSPRVANSNPVPNPAGFD